MQLKHMTGQSGFGDDFTIAHATEITHRLVAPDDPGLYYSGRIDQRDRRAPVIIWQGTEIRAVFTGKTIGFRFADAWGQNYFNVIIDGALKLLKLKEAGTHDYLLAEALPEGLHHLVLFKRSEAMFGQASFRGLLLEKGAGLGPKPEPFPLRIEFYGDSITAGACNEDPGSDQYEDLATHNNYLSYAAITARNLNAEYCNHAVSGTGICYSWNPVLMPEIYDKLYPDRNSPKYAFTDPNPDLVVINLGQNDYAYPKSIGKPFPLDYREKYVEFVRAIRNLYPKALIVCAIGGMDCYHVSEEFRSAFQAAVAELKRSDPQLYSFTFTAFTTTHPRVDTHLKMAGELTAFLKQLPL